MSFAKGSSRQLSGISSGQTPTPGCSPGIGILERRERAYIVSENPLLLRRDGYLSLHVFQETGRAQSQHRDVFDVLPRPFRQLLLYAAQMLAACPPTMIKGHPVWSRCASYRAERL